MGASEVNCKIRSYVECSLGDDKMDRDVPAIVNFVLCAVAALRDERHPVHLFRP